MSAAGTVRAATAQRVAIVGAGWAGLAAAVRAVQAGHRVTLLDAARAPGGRARRVPVTPPDGRTLALDNGQHILIGAYVECLALLRTVGVAPEQVLQRQPLALRFADGGGLAWRRGPATLAAAAAILHARGWSWRERGALLSTLHRWRRMRFTCDSGVTVAALCAHLPARARAEFTELLCVAALNTPPSSASGEVFLRVLHDALAQQRGSDLLLPRVDLGTLFPDPACRWLATHGAHARFGVRVERLEWQEGRWQLLGEVFDTVILATPAPAAAAIARQSAATAPAVVRPPMLDWAASAARLGHHAITTVYARPAHMPPALAPHALLALRGGPQAPAQFVFNRARLTGEPGLIALVVSLSRGDRAAIEHAVCRQAGEALGVELEPVFTLTEKRATFACVAGQPRPGAVVAPRLLACGDYVEGPYPATLEGAVRSGSAAARRIAALD